VEWGRTQSLDTAAVNECTASAKTPEIRSVPVAARFRCRSAAACLLRLWVRIPPGNGALSVVSVIYCQVEVSATS
jgi:hypothetical protein